MKHGSVHAVLDWLEWQEPPRDLVPALEALETWLADEGVKAGAIGPGETERLWDRHLADSLSFARPWVGDAPATLFDAGSGIGLPGLPLAALFSETNVILVDRSAERLRLARRAARAAGLENVDTWQRELREIDGPLDAVTMRAVLPPATAVRFFGRVLGQVGIGVLGLARADNPPPGVEGHRALARKLDLRADLMVCDRFDPAAWLLSMSAA